jgi:hypothetical protein
LEFKLSSKHKIIAFVYTLLLVLILGLEYYEVNFSLISWIRFLTMLSLAIVVFLNKKENFFKGVSLVFILMVAGDFFLVLSNAIEVFEQNLAFLGFIPFTLAYLLLATIYLKSLKLNLKDVIISIPFVLLGLLLYSILYPFVEGVFLKIVSIILLAVLLTMSWSAVLFLTKDTFSKNRSIIIAISGILMLACDLGVAFDIFYPSFYQIRDIIPINLVWLFYIPGWVLLAIASIKS